MAIKKGNRTVPITLLPYHQRKLKIICNRTNLSKSGVMQRLLEQYDVFSVEAKEE